MTNMEQRASHVKAADTSVRATISSLAIFHFTALRAFLVVVVAFALTLRMAVVRIARAQKRQSIKSELLLTYLNNSPSNAFFKKVLFEFI